MALIELELPWTSQPQEVVQVSPAWTQHSPLLVADASTGFVNQVNGDLPSEFSSNAVTAAYAAGIGTTGSTYARNVKFKDFPFGGTAPITIVAVVDIIGNAFGCYVGQATEIVLRSSAAGKVQFLLNSFTGSDRVEVTAGPPIDGRHVIVGTYGQSGKMRIYGNHAMAELAVTGAYANVGDVFEIIGTPGLASATTSAILRVMVFADEIPPESVHDLVDNPWQVSTPQSIWVPVSAGGGGPTPAGTATETDASLTLSGVQLRAVGQAAETDAAQALVAVQIASTGRADETETALALTPVQITVAGLASETDAALALDPGATGTVGVALETDVAMTLAAVQITATGIATEVDTALALTGLAGTAPGVASETDTAFALAAVQKLVAGAALEVDTALALSTPGGTLDLILKILTNRQELNPVTGTFTLYDDDGTTVLYTTNAWADAAGTTPYSGGALRRIDALF